MWSSDIGDIAHKIGYIIIISSFLRCQHNAGIDTPQITVVRPYDPHHRSAGKTGSQIHGICDIGC